ncbi:hypothetical protein [Pyxidicoccus sp. MSG2]|uniref:Kelch repeat-containing protein n=1 Tax=Pyxidicoccus sp. MSG2 TaxID=2996790 RepID=UPI00226D9F56|nr:hypothetical protein [Pyxidicoccus sp. MSG2]MCY1022690.1 hypothetical protein [Pyxidicoccus sp. MSG2]
MTLPALLVLCLACNAVEEPTPFAEAASEQGLTPVTTVSWQFAEYPRPQDGYVLASLGTQAVLFSNSEGMFTWDGAAWNPRVAQGWPSSRSVGHMVAHGAGLLMFGGYDSSSNAYVDETWQWDGTGWTRLLPATTPPARAGQGMTVVAGKVVMYGGHSAQGRLDDTWTWDGVDWTRITTATSPATPSVSMVTVGDSALLLGYDSSAPFAAETWTFDGSGWTKIATPTSLPGLSRYELATLGGVPLAYDGTSTWRWSGADWVKASPVASPTTRSPGPMVAAGPTVLLFGGSVSGSTTYDTWTFDGTTWTERWKMPVSMKGASMATLGGKVVLFRDTQTWEWDGRAWSQRTPATVPPARQYAAMATLGNKVVMYGGGSDTRTWLWDGNNWTGLTTAHTPGARKYVGMAPLGGRLVLFGGLDLSQLSLADTWQFDGVDWKQLAPTNRPGSRGGYGMATVAGSVLLFGGAYTDGANPSNTYYYSDLWIWNGTNWLPGARGPGARYAPIMAELDGKAVLNGGRSSPSSSGVFLSDTWLYDPVTGWSQPQTTRTPPGLHEAAAATLGHTVVKWGGGRDYYYGIGGTWTLNAFMAEGSNCSVSAQCETGWCVDGVCCQTACSGTCESCNLPGTEGLCTTVPAGEPRPGTCASCNGDGGCDMPWPEDAGSGVADAGPVDGGNDAGANDGGTVGSDAGPPPGIDAGAVADGGSGPGKPGGSSCLTGLTGGNAWLVMLATCLGMGARRRRRD